MLKFAGNSKESARSESRHFFSCVCASPADVLAEELAMVPPLPSLSLTLYDLAAASSSFLVPTAASILDSGNGLDTCVDAGIVYGVAPSTIAATAKTCLTAHMVTMLAPGMENHDMIADVCKDLSNTVTNVHAINRSYRSRDKRDNND
jgi:hypothetical protein